MGVIRSLDQDNLGEIIGVKYFERKMFIYEKSPESNDPAPKNFRSTPRMATANLTDG
ncbi:hypothetical protein DPF_1483 [Desulfoplanes formicivorans]|uniref:Uncharacterized protein n=1 Tax=Desulfoplanes formicivorans TaxID=1592317 RepID=A0A194AFC0_9BACT|nr:hypothetical protein DPF_1483 [Desulfoplanes formicivorans]